MSADASAAATDADDEAQPGEEAAAVAAAAAMTRLELMVSLLEQYGHPSNTSSSGGWSHDLAVFLRQVCVPPALPCGAGGDGAAQAISCVCSTAAAGSEILHTAMVERQASSRGHGRGEGAAVRICRPVPKVRGSGRVSSAPAPAAFPTRPCRRDVQGVHYFMKQLARQGGGRGYEEAAGFLAGDGAARSVPAGVSVRWVPRSGMRQGRGGGAKEGMGEQGTRFGSVVGSASR